MYRKLCVIVAGILVTAAPLAAQDKPGVFIIGGGYTAPNSEVRDHLGDGYNFTIGGQLNVNPKFGIEGLYSFNGLGDKERTIAVSPSPGAPGVPTEFSASMNMQYGTIAAVLQDPSGSVRPYGLTGIGLYYRPIKVTTPGVGWVPGYCNPYWYVCSPGGFVEVENIIGERSSTDFGMVFGGGLSFGSFFSELRYHYIWGPEIEDGPIAQPIEDNSTYDRKANGQFLAVTFGFKF